MMDPLPAPPNQWQDYPLLQSYTGGPPDSMAQGLSLPVLRCHNGIHGTDRTSLRSHLPHQLEHTQDVYTRLSFVNLVHCLESTVRPTKHDQPFRLLYAVFVRLGITEVLPVYLASFVNFILCPVTNENRLSTPFDNHLVSLAHAVTNCILRHVHFSPRESLQVQFRLLPGPIHPPRRTCWPENLLN